MTPFETYKEYLALKNHFTTSGYDYFKYNGKGSGSLQSFEKRKDKLFFEKLSKHPDPKGLMISNFSRSSKVWVRDLAYSEESQQIYLDWLKRSQSILYNLKLDLKHLDTDFNSNFIVPDNEHPNLLKLYLSDMISIESFCILVDITSCYTYWTKKLANDPLWDEIALYIRKYTPFIKYDKKKAKELLIDFYGN